MADKLYPVTVPKWGIEMQEGTITGWQVELGAAVSKGDDLIDIESDKIVNTMEAPVDGVLCRQIVEEGDTLKVGELLGVIAREEVDDEVIDAFVRDFEPADASFGIDEEESPKRPAEAPVSAERTGKQAGGTVRASPVARRLAKQLGVDLSLVQGTGRNGRISKQDVEAAVAEQKDAGSPDAQARPLSTRRQTIAKRLVAAKQEIPHYYLTRSLAMERALALKSDTVSLNAILMAAVARALADNPDMNCHLLEAGIVRRDSVDINMAVDTEQGLTAPLLREVDRMSLAELTEKAKDLAERARANKLEAADLEPGGFTVSNLGALGIESFTAIINPPQAAILAVGALYDRPVWKQGEVTTMPSVRVTLSADHRIVDGADGARFLAAIAGHLDKLEG